MKYILTTILFILISFQHVYSGNTVDSDVIRWLVTRSKTLHLDSDGDGSTDLLDCSPSDKTAWANISYNSVDLDSDGIKKGISGILCTDGNLPAGYFTSPLGGTYPDCNDSDASTWRKSVIYHDLDGDGVGSGKGLLTCIGSAPESGFSFLGYDPIDDLSNPDSKMISDTDIPPYILSAPAVLSESVEDSWPF